MKRLLINTGLALLYLSIIAFAARLAYRLIRSFVLYYGAWSEAITLFLIIYLVDQLLNKITHGRFNRDLL